MLDNQSFTIEGISVKDGWRICNFVVSNSDRLKRYFPTTLESNLTPALSEIFVTQKVKQYENKIEFLFTLKEKEDRSIIGLIYLKKIDWNKKTGELAYCIGYQYEGKGITTKTVQYISDWAFNEMHLNTLEIIAHKTNLGSVVVAKNCGYKWSKTLLKEHTPPNEEPLDMELYELYHER